MGGKSLFTRTQRHISLRLLSLFSYKNISIFSVKGKCVACSWRLKIVILSSGMYNEAEARGSTLQVALNVQVVHCSVDGVRARRAREIHVYWALICRDIMRRDDCQSDFSCRFSADWVHCRLPSRPRRAEFEFQSRLPPKSAAVRVFLLLHPPSPPSRWFPSDRLRPVPSRPVPFPFDYRNTGIQRHRGPNQYSVSTVEHSKVKHTAQGSTIHTGNSSTHLIRNSDPHPHQREVRGTADSQTAAAKPLHLSAAASATVAVSRRTALTFAYWIIIAAHSSALCSRLSSAAPLLSAPRRVHVFSVRRRVYLTAHIAHRAHIRRVAPLTSIESPRRSERETRRVEESGEENTRRSSRTVRGIQQLHCSAQILHTQQSSAAKTEGRPEDYRHTGLTVSPFCASVQHSSVSASRRVRTADFLRLNVSTLAGYLRAPLEPHEYSISPPDRPPNFPSEI